MKSCIPFHAFNGAKQMRIKTCLCEHNAANTEITVRARRNAPAVIFPIEFAPTGENSTASMIAAGKFFAARGLSVEPLDQIRVHKLERHGSYVTRVRCAV
jgi:hypothetical protein